MTKGRSSRFLKLVKCNSMDLALRYFWETGPSDFKSLILIQIFIFTYQVSGSQTGDHKINIQGNKI